MHAIDTSGRAVLFAGGTVVISLLGLFVIGVSFIRGLAVGASLAVLFVMAAAVTLLPAVLGFVGHTIDKFALPSARKKRTHRAELLGAVEPHAAGAARGPPRSRSLLILLVLAIPFVSLRLGVADAGNDPTKFTTRRAYDLLSQGFGPGFNGPLLLASDVGSPRRRRRDEPPARQAIARRPRRRSRSSPVDPEPERRGRADPGRRRRARRRTRARPQLVHRLRDDVVPDATEGSTLDVHVGGQTAIGVDLADTLGHAPALHVPRDPAVSASSC